MITVVAHRGDCESARENTPEAFAAAVEAGADVVELDIRTTADGTSVVLHDATLLRLWGAPVRVSEQRHLPAGIPTLAATLEQFADLNRERSRPVSVLVDTVCVDDARAALEVVEAFATGPDAALVPIAWCGDVEAMLHVRERLPEADITHDHDGGQMDHESVRRLQPSAVNVEWIHLTEALVEQVHRMGLELAVWSIDDAPTMSLAIELGVDRITTGRPRLLRRLLSQGTSPLALAGMEVGQLAVHAGTTRKTAHWIHVAQELAQWSIGFTRTAALGRVDSKAHAADLVTQVDLAVERHVRRVIEETFEGRHLVVGEELGGSAEPGRPTWFLDPVDGTTNLANGLPWTSMSLALAVDGQPVVAAVAQPALGHVFLAARELGATLDGVPLELAPVPRLAGRTVLVELDAHRMWPGMERFLHGLAAQHCTARIMGSGTLSLAGIAAGWAAAGVVHRFSPVDHLAGLLIAQEAGAEVRELDGAFVVAAPGAAGMVADLLA
ncbi:inositol monophosphatase family protein [Luteococcus peritonei]|uniref:Inositol monophosphatase family protein n=1 Tax=Luteococcus peritonei TaxID=88874 RepID=A0ABW4RV74_9ACTN